MLNCYVPMEINLNFLLFEANFATYLSHRHLFDDCSSEVDFDLLSNESSIYVISKAKKVRYKVDDCSLTDKRNMTAVITVEGKETFEFNYSLYKLIEDLSHMCPTEEDFLDCFSDEDDNILIKFIKAESNGTHLAFRLEIMGNEIPKNLYVSIEKLLDLESGFDFNNPPEIAYIGQSIDVLRRLKKHEKVNEALSRLSDDEEIRLNFLSFKLSGRIDGKLSSMRGIIDGDDYKTTMRISLIERFLIYQFRPYLNIQHTSTNLEKDTLFIKLMKEQHCSLIGCGLEFEGKLWDFWSPNQQLESSSIQYDMNVPSLGLSEFDANLFVSTLSVST
jgi:hypothetical protein